MKSKLSESKMLNRINIELKAKCIDISGPRDCLKSLNALFKGLDYQTDTYFNVKKGRLKIREGNIENCLVYYERENTLSPKKCRYDIINFKPEDKSLELIKKILISSLGIKIKVEKKREIYFIGNVKFHLDTVENLGNFVEIEAIGNESENEEFLMEQCNEYLKKIGIKKCDLLGESYSDLIKR